MTNKPLDTSELPKPPPEVITPNLLLAFLPLLHTFRQPIQHRIVTTVPTFTPKTWPECIQPFDDGVTRGVHIFINGTWRVISAT